jgi:hypothetical protein
MQQARAVPRVRFHLPPSLTPLIPGHSNISLILSDTMRGTEKYDRICVGVCRPRSMLDMTRNAAAAAHTNAGPTVDLQMETYG